jgi:hypothetical protein
MTFNLVNSRMAAVLLGSVFDNGAGYGSGAVKRSGAQFGLSEKQWGAAKDEVREAILEAAHDRRMTWYGEVASKVSSVSLDPHSALMNHLLGGVFEEEHAAGRPALTSIVTHKHGDKEPGSGFYEMARSLGYRFREPYVFWAQQVQDVFKLYGKAQVGDDRRRVTLQPLLSPTAWRHCTERRHRI